MSVEPPEVLPIQPRVLVLKCRHVETREGVNTVIGRKVENPEACRRCIGEPCNHDGGFCVVIAPEYVPPDLCAGYVLRARPGAAQGEAGRGVEGG